MPGPRAERWRTRAFGLEITASFPAPGLPEARRPRLGQPVRLELAPRTALDEGWPDTGTDRLLEESFGRKTPDRTIDVHPRLGYRLFARHFGVARVSPS